MGTNPGDAPWRKARLGAQVAADQEASRLYRQAAMNAELQARTKQKIQH